LAERLPKRWETAEAVLLLEWAGFPAVTDAELYSHGAFFLADLSWEGGRARQPRVEPGLPTTIMQCLDGGDRRLDGSELRAFFDGESVRMTQ
jgi:hypothetical protein